MDFHSHLLSFGEFAMIYLFWSNVLWDLSALNTFDEILESWFAGVTPGDPFGAIFQTRDTSDQPRIDPAVLLGFIDAVLPFGSGPNHLTAAELRSALKPRDEKGKEPSWRKPSIRLA